jgi:zinc transport system permease protein
MIGQTARALGALPAFALSTLPAIAALQLARGPLWVPFVVGALAGALAGVGGYVAAFFFGLPVGSAQTVLAALLVGAAVVIRLAVRGMGRLRVGDPVRSS